MVTIYQTQSLSDAHAVRTALLVAGIPATVSGEYSIGTIAGGLAVHIQSPDEVAAARRVIVDLGLDQVP